MCAEAPFAPVFADNFVGSLRLAIGDDHGILLCFQTARVDAAQGAAVTCDFERGGGRRRDKVGTLAVGVVRARVFGANVLHVHAHVR